MRGSRIYSARAPANGRGTRARQLRIIGGKWRGRRWQFPESAIRPTPDRVRETLFNWLQFRLANRRCLDLFAGSGALGLEALSRGAAHVLFVDVDAGNARALEQQLHVWGAGNAAVHSGRAELLLRGPPQPFDLVFLDPPFAGALLAEAVSLLGTEGWLSAGALIYMEQSRRSALPALPRQWRLLKSGAAGEVGYHLFENQAQESAA